MLSLDGVLTSSLVVGLRAVIRTNGTLGMGIFVTSCWSLCRFVGSRCLVLRAYWKLCFYRRHKAIAAYKKLP
jgi:hypothetical protein